MLSVYAADTDCLADAEVFDSLYRTVQPCRREKIDRLRFEKDKRLSLGAGLLLKRALEEAGCRYDSAEFAEDENGRPFLLGSSLQFSLSHTENRVLCALSDRAVGCDAEKVGRFDMAIAERFFCPEETAQIRAQAEPDAQAETFFRLWTLKESFSKALGLGLLLAFNSFCVTLGDPPCLHQEIRKEPFFLRELPPHNGIFQSICAQDAQKCCICEVSLL